MEVEQLHPRPASSSTTFHSRRTASSLADRIWMLVRLYAESHPVLVSTIVFVVVTAAVSAAWGAAYPHHGPRGRHQIHHDYSKIEYNFNFRATQMDHWCLFVSALSLYYSPCLSHLSVSLSDTRLSLSRSLTSWDADRAKTRTAPVRISPTPFRGAKLTAGTKPSLATKSGHPPPRGGASPRTWCCLATTWLKYGPGWGSTRRSLTPAGRQFKESGTRPSPRLGAGPWMDWRSGSGAIRYVFFAGTSRGAVLLATHSNVLALFDFSTFLEVNQPALEASER